MIQAAFERRDEHDNGERDAGIAIRAFFHAKSGAQKSQRKYRSCEDQKISSKIVCQKRPGQSTQSGSGNAFDRN